MRLLTWNINHRTKRKPVPAQLAEAIGSLTVDVAVLTEYVPAPSREDFFKQLESVGLKYKRMSRYTPGENHVLIASRGPLEDGDILADEIAPSVRSNALHVRVLGEGLEVLGLRVPDFSKEPRLRRACWDWILATAGAVKGRPFVILGDFNTDPSYMRAKCGDRIGILKATGWQHADPPEGQASYWTLRGDPKRIDHAFVSLHFTVRSARYVRENGPYVFAKGPGRLSDHAALVVDITALRPARPGIT